MSASRIPDAVKRVFTEIFTARDVAEPLAPFDASASASDVRAFMEASGLNVVGVRSEGHVAGYVPKNSLDEGACARCMRTLNEAIVLCASAPLLTV
jgi:hypothetical protein